MTIGYIEDRIAKIEMEIQNLQEEHDALEEGVLYLRNEILKIKTVKADPIRHGEWILMERREPQYDIAGVKTWGVAYRCSECGFEHSVIEDFGHYTFCPNCGAKMGLKVHYCDRTKCLQMEYNGKGCAECEGTE